MKLQPHLIASNTVDLHMHKQGLQEDIQQGGGSLFSPKPKQAVPPTQA